MNWGERWKVAQTLYRELCFQSIYALKSGNAFHHREDPDYNPGQKAIKRIFQSKVTVCVLFGLSALAVAGILLYGQMIFLDSGQPITLSPLYFETASISLALIVVFSLVWITGLQVALPFITSQSMTALRALPLSEEDLEGISALAFLHLFDLPLLTGLVLFPVGIFLGTHSGLAALASIPAILSTEIFALALSLVTGRFFARTVSGSSGGSLRNLLTRWAYLVLWTIPSLAITIFIVFSKSIFASLDSWQFYSPNSLAALFTLFPFPFSWVVASVAIRTAVQPDTLGIPNALPFPFVLLWSAALIAYVLLAMWAAWWLVKAPLNLSRTMALVQGLDHRDPRVRVSSGPIAVVKKDLRIASRTPAYAFLLLLPMLDAFVLGLFSYLGSPTPAQATRYADAAVIVAVLLATFFGPVFFATEIMGFSLTRTLPISQRTLILGKTVLIGIVYVVAFLLVALLDATRVSNLPVFLLYAAAEVPAILAAAFLEIGLILWRAESTGVPLTSLYSGAWWVTMVSLPGLTMAGVPLLLFHFVPSVPLMAGAAIAMLVPTAWIVLHDRDRAL